ncbi:MAG: MFS transporter [Gemmatimonadaceae bacterium]|nr:MFS transporter [Gemmatimonadaceae bacterium]
MSRAALAAATFLCLVPVTLLVPGLHELVVVAHGGTESDAHAFMTVNMIAGMVTVPLAMRALRRSPGDVRRWAAIALLADAVAFAGMAFAPSLGVLYVFRVLDGAAHLPAITLLMVASNRLTNEGRGGALGALASAIMVGVAIGSPLGGWLVPRGPMTVYLTGAVLLLVAAGVCAGMPRQEVQLGEGSRYAWNRRSFASWIPLGYGFLDRFSIGVFVSTFTLYLTNEVGLSAPQRGALVALFMLPFAMLCYPAGRLADRMGWFWPLLVGNVLFGMTFALYGVVAPSWLPVAMVASGVFSALMYAPNLLLISDLARRGHGEGLFGAFQVAGSLGFLVGPIVGGTLVALTRESLGRPAYAAIFGGVGVVAALFAVVCWSAGRRLSREVRDGGVAASSALADSGA